MMLLAVTACVCLVIGFVFGRATVRFRIAIDQLADERARVRGRELPLAPIVDLRPPHLRAAPTNGAARASMSAN